MMKPTNKTSGSTKVVDFAEVRAQKIEEKRRKTQRVIFKNILGTYCVEGGDRMRSIDLMDVSEDGFSFRAPFESVHEHPFESDELNLRMYFTQDTYLPVVATIQNSRPYIEEGIRYVRFGCTVDEATRSSETYKQFVKFLGLYAEHSHKDEGGVTLFYL